MSKAMSRAVLSLVALLGFVLAPIGSAVAAEEKPFADHKFVLQISDNDPTKQTLVLNVASNLLKHYGPDVTDVEIVGFGPGLRLMFAGNANEGRIEGLAGQGVRFAACGNTMKKVTQILGDEPKLTSYSKEVPAGVVRIAELVDKGYILVKP